MTRPSISRPDPHLGPAELRRTLAPECSDFPAEPSPFSEGLRIGALAAGVIATSLAIGALVFGALSGLR